MENTLGPRKKFKDLLLEFLSEREIEVLKYRYGIFGKSERTLESIGREFGVSRERIRQIQSNAIKKLRRKYVTPISPNKLPLFFVAETEKSGLIKLSVDISSLKYESIYLNDQKFFIEKGLSKNLYTVLDEINSLPRNFSFKMKKEKLFELAQEYDFPDQLLREVIKSLRKKRFKSEIVRDIILENGYPMHFTEIFELLPDRSQIRSPRDVLTKLQVEDDMFVRISNGTYMVKNKEYNESVPFIKDIIEEYLEKNKEGTPEKIFDYVIKQRQCSRASINIFLNTNPEFELIRSGVYSLRKVNKKNHQAFRFRELLEIQFKESEFVEIGKFISIIQKDLPEISIKEVYMYLKRDPKITVKDNFILKNK